MDLAYSPLHFGRLITAWPMVIDMFLQEPLPVTGQSYAKGIRTHYEPGAELRTLV
jgi:hypothetical protein